MSDPTPVVRAVTYERDGERCVSCGARSHLTYQHRAATGMGGSKVRPRLEDGLTACLFCNEAYEAEWQTEALLSGWKVARWVNHLEDVPVFYVTERKWFQLTVHGGRWAISEAAALRMMHDVYGDQYDEWRAAA